jgi:hypothetical protein
VWDALLRDPTLARQALFPGVAQFFSESALQRALARSQPARGWDPVPTRQAFYRECLALKPNAHVYELMVAHECQYRIPELLFANFETASREIGVRLLYPYLTPRFVRLVSGLKASARFMRGEGQWISKLPLRRLASPLLPEEIVRRPRGSYTTAFAYWMQLPAFSRPTLARLERSAFWKLGLVSKAWHKRLVGVVSHASAPTSPEGSASLYQLWALLTLVSWYDRFVMRKI